MDLTLKLNARFQPKHRFELEDALQEILEKSRQGRLPEVVRHKTQTVKLHTAILIFI